MKYSDEFTEFALRIVRDIPELCFEKSWYINDYLTDGIDQDDSSMVCGTLARFLLDNNVDKGVISKLCLIINDLYTSFLPEDRILYFIEVDFFEIIIENDELFDLFSEYLKKSAKVMLLLMHNFKDRPARIEVVSEYKKYLEGIYLRT